MIEEKLREVTKQAIYKNSIYNMILLSDVNSIIKQEIEDAKPKWISVKDRLPHPETMGKKILINYKGEVHIGKITPNGWNLFCSDGNCYFHIPIMDEVTHWMPLPESPEEKL